MNQLPNMNYCAARGWVQYPPPAPPPKPKRRYRKHRLTAAEYSRIYRAKLHAAGLTQRGTPRKYKINAL